MKCEIAAHVCQIIQSMWWCVYEGSILAVCWLTKDKQYWPNKNLHCY